MTTHRIQLVSLTCWRGTASVGGCKSGWNERNVIFSTFFLRVAGKPRSFTWACTVAKIGGGSNGSAADGTLWSHKMMSVVLWNDLKDPVFVCPCARQLLHIWEATNCTAKVGLPRCLVTLSMIPPWLNGPSSKDWRICVWVIVSVLCMTPRDAKDTMILVFPFQTWMLSALNLPYEPIFHPFWSLARNSATAANVAAGSSWRIAAFLRMPLGRELHPRTAAAFSRGQYAHGGENVEDGSIFRSRWIGDRSKSIPTAEVHHCSQHLCRVGRSWASFFRCCCWHAECSSASTLLIYRQSLTTANEPRTPPEAATCVYFRYGPEDVVGRVKFVSCLSAPFQDLFQSLDWEKGWRRAIFLHATLSSWNIVMTFMSDNCIHRSLLGTLALSVSIFICWIGCNAVFPCSE